MPDTGSTSLGTLDLLGTIDEGTSYEELLADSEELSIGGVPIRVVSLERLISIKERLTRPKDQMMLVVLRVTLNERTRT